MDRPNRGRRKLGSFNRFVGRRRDRRRCWYSLFGTVVGYLEPLLVEVSNHADSGVWSLLELVHRKGCVRKNCDNRDQGKYICAEASCRCRTVKVRKGIPECSSGA